MGRQRIMRLNLNGTYDEKVVKTDANKLQVGKEDAVDFEPIAVFTENKPRRAFHRGAKKLVLFVDGAKRALTFTKATDELQIAWTKKEATGHVNKVIAQAHEQQKVIKTWQFVVIIALQIFMIVLMLKFGGVIRV